MSAHAAGLGSVLECPMVAAAMARAAAMDSETSQGRTSMALAAVAPGTAEVPRAVPGATGVQGIDTIGVQERTESPGAVACSPHSAGHGHGQSSTTSLGLMVQVPTESLGVPPSGTAALARPSTELSTWTHLPAASRSLVLGERRRADLIALPSLRAPTLAEWRNTPALHSLYWPCFKLCVAIFVVCPCPLC